TLSKFTTSLSQYSSFFTKTISSSCSHSSSANGPFATNVSASACQSGSSSATLWLTGKNAGLVTKSGKNPVGCFSSTSSVLSSTAVTATSSSDPSPLLYSSAPSIKYAKNAAGDGGSNSGSSNRFHAYSKSSATTGSPLEQLASSRISNVYTNPSSETSNSSAVAGWATPSSSKRVNPSNKLFNGS